MTDHPGHILVIGAGIGGLRTIEALREAQYDGQITLVGAEVHLPYDRPPLSKQVLAGEWEHERTALTDHDGLAGLAVDVKLGSPVVALHGTKATLSDGSTIEADAVVVSTGLRARRLPRQSDRFHTLRTLDDALELRGQLSDAKSLLIVGAGFIGTEIASTAAKQGLEVTIVESLGIPFERALGREVGGVCARLIVEGDVTLRCGASVEKFVETEAGVGVLLTDGTKLLADVGVVGIGGVPDLEWLADAGLTLSNGLRCDATGRAVGSDNVWAVGDVAAWQSSESDEFVRSEHWNSTLDQARIVANSILGLANGSAPEPYFWSDQFGLKIQVLGRVSQSESVVQLHGEGLTGGTIKGTVVGHFRDDTIVAVTGFGAPRLIARYRSPIADNLVHSKVLELAESLDQRVRPSS